MSLVIEDRTCFSGFCPCLYYNSLGLGKRPMIRNVFWLLLLQSKLEYLGFFRVLHLLVGFRFVFLDITWSLDKLSVCLDHSEKDVAD